MGSKIGRINELSKLCLKKAQKIVAPKNGGDFNDCLPYENSYGEPAFTSSNREQALNYFLVVSAAGAATALLSTFTVESATAGFAVVSAAGVAVESALGASGVPSPLLQAVKAAAITRAKSTFFIF
jgi:hypothetical protein